MNELRRAMLDSTGGPPELSADLRFLAARQASLAALVLDHAQHYKVLYTAARETGTTEEIRTAALNAAGNLGTAAPVAAQPRGPPGRARPRARLHPHPAPRGRPALLQLHAAGRGGRGPDRGLAGVGGDRIGELAGVGGDRIEELDAALAPEGVDELFRSQRVREWLHGLGELAPGE